MISQHESENPYPRKTFLSLAEHRLFLEYLLSIELFRFKEELNVLERGIQV